MNRQRWAYGGAAAVLGAVTVLGVGAIFVLGPDGGTVTQAAADEAVEAPPERPTLPIDVATTGVADLVANQVRVGTTPAVLGERTTRVCDAEVVGWVRSESARVSGPQVSLNVQVAGYRAGGASQTYSDLRNAAGGCSDVNSEDGQDQFVASRSEQDGDLAFGVLRLGDVLTVVSASSGSTDPTGAVEESLTNARAALTPRLAKSCADPTSTSNGSHIERDPYAQTYSGFKIPRLIPLPNQPPLAPTQIEVVRSEQPETKWVAPDPRPYPALAPIAANQPNFGFTPNSSPTRTPTLADIKRDPAPLLVDPATIRPPVEPEPVQDPGSEPMLPGFGALSATAIVPALDQFGPGCGWAFARTAAPVVTKQQVADGTRDAVIQALVTETEVQSQSMLDALAWPSRHREWVRVSSIAADWDAYRAAQAEAATRFQEAKDVQEASMKRWRESLLAPAPSPTPKPTRTSPSPSPSNTGRDR